MLSSLKEKFTTFVNKSNLRAGTIWTISGFGSDIFVRMLSSLILTRIFAPEVFGLMAIITALLMGMEMISEVGVRSSIIQNPKGEQSNFLNTAWTIQIIRGITLWTVLYLITPSIADYYNEPLLLSLIPLASLNLVIRSFVSVHVYVYSRALKVKRIVIMSIIIQSLSALFTITLALVIENVLAIVLGSIFSAIVNLLLSFILFKQPKSKIQLDKSIVLEIFHLAKWLFLASVFTFFVGNGDRLIIGKLVSRDFLGLYNLAAMFSQIPISILSSLSSFILMPYLSKSYHSNPLEFNHNFNHLIRKILNYMLPLIGALIVFGQLIISLLYSDEFSGAGEILSLLAVATMFQVACLAVMPLFLARGNSFKHMLAYFSIFILKSGFIYLGFYLFKVEGALYGIIIAQLLWFPIISIIAKDYVSLDLFKIMTKIVLITLFSVFLSYTLNFILINNTSLIAVGQ